MVRISHRFQLPWRPLRELLRFGCSATALRPAWFTFRILSWGCIKFATPRSKLTTPPPV
jgi:hypothetical protein